jgi:hypothetical protein
MWVFLSEPNEAVFIKNTLELKWMSTCNSKTIKDQQVVKYKASTEKAGIKFVELKSFEEFVKKN